MTTDDGQKATKSTTDPLHMYMQDDGKNVPKCVGIWYKFEPL